MKSRTLASLLSFFAIAFLVAVSCSKDENLSANQRTLSLPDQPYRYDFGNDRVATLGRVLFYDNSLSVNNGVSCGACHKQVLAFADNKRFSIGFEHRASTRNTPPIQNLQAASPVTTFPASQGQALFWDGRERDLKTMITKPIFHNEEMGMRQPQALVEKVASKEYYKPLFADAFGSEEVDFDNIAEALSQFVGSISASGSEFDRSKRTALGGEMSPIKEQGMNLFFTKYNCGSCHNLFDNKGYNSSNVGQELVNIGLDASYSDQGAGALSKEEADNGKFKIPNLRNVAITAPYMHDGRFETLEEVIEHYNSGIQSHPNLDHRLRDLGGAPMAMNISEAEKAAMIAFMESLTDYNLLTDPRFSDPFVKR